MKKDNLAAYVPTKHFLSSIFFSKRQTMTDSTKAMVQVQDKLDSNCLAPGDAVAETAVTA